MSTKNQIKVYIGEKAVTISGYESEEYLQRVAAYLTGKIRELETMSGYRRLPVDTKNHLLSLNIADDYFKAKKQAEILEEDLQIKDREMYELKDELINLKVQLENTQKELERSKRESAKNNTAQLRMDMKNM
ncbi:MAG TPA: cell division protein ZapA [Lachnospiraceae bacterium]